MASEGDIPPPTLAFMELALQQAQLALDTFEVPVGCVIVEDGKVIASGRNQTVETRNATRHAEMEAIDVLLEKWQCNGLSESEVAQKFSRCDLYVTCEPCIMCAAALSILAIDLHKGRLLNALEVLWHQKPSLFFEVFMSRATPMLQNLIGRFRRREELRPKSYNSRIY